MSIASNLPQIEKVVTQEQVGRYARASGDHNPIHLDAEFAAGTSFGRTIAHGMLVLAFISEMMTRAFGRRWLEGGGLKVRFKAPVYPGDKVMTFGTLKEAKPHDGVQMATYAVGCRTGSDQEVITGEAWVKLPFVGE